MSHPPNPTRVPCPRAEGHRGGSSVPSGQRDAPGSQTVIAVFRTRNSPVFELLPWYVRSLRVDTHVGFGVILGGFMPTIPWGAVEKTLPPCAPPLAVLPQNRLRFGRLIRHPPGSALLRASPNVLVSPQVTRKRRVLP